MGYELTIQPLGTTIEIEEGQTILDAALRAGIYLPHACCHGLCATCKIDVVEGEVDYGEASTFALMDFERQEGKCLACCARPESDLVIEAEIEEDPDALNLPVRDFAGTVSRLENLSPTIKGVWIRLDDPAGFVFQAGQYVNLDLPGGIGTRAFSVASQPGADEVELNIRIVPGGKGTTYVHESLKVGDRIGFSGPYGRFFVRKSADVPLIFMAGGSGLSSPRSMILDLLAEGFDKPITLVYGQRNRAELYYHQDFLELAARHAHFTYVPALSDEPAASDWAGFRGFVHDAAKAHFDNDFRGHKAYLCGPPLMIEACIGTLMKGRLFERDVYTEKFLSAADAQQVRSPLFKAI
ncbi:NADH:ubiquinone reductase (Na(+)-transporting) subunit F [Zavarzinia compransoris]|uniref:Phenol hydroxylase n=1 Tax=Zavarzinia compransoris TaxID=1264899 RepID=A0A317E7S0_9PROT|nr:phenol 2-monooxygenase domain-containing protein [Zavarzinia compransoris]PWR23178.1 phenol hydroxylase [Zavarzinia compransoris]TDP46264.1 phenol 2-monooxygenase P5 subunit [Zavarzinia compransoris]